jgi:hypothetical protein
VIFPAKMISLPKVDEYDTGFRLEMICIHGGKLSFGNRAVLANIRGRFMKLDISVGICQSELDIVKSR